MANDFLGPLSPEQLAAVQGYYGVPGVNMSTPPMGPPAPPPVSDAGAYYNYNPAPEAPSAPPPAPSRPVGAQLSQVGDPQVAPFSGTGPAAPSAPYFGAQLNAADVLAGSPGFEGKTASQLAPGAKPAAPKPTITGVTATPSADEDRAFAALRKLQDMRPAARGGGGGGGPGNPDPYGVKGAQKSLLSGFDKEAEGLQAQSSAEGDRAAMRGDGMRDLARMQEEDAAIRAAEMDMAQRDFDNSMSEVTRQLDAVRNQKVDPTRLMQQDGMGIRAVIGGMLGGIYMGLNKMDHNPFMDDLNKQIDRDIAAQEKNIDNARGAAGERMNLLREQRATFKDNDLAKLATRRTMYEAMEHHIEAEASRFDQPIAKARADQALAVLGRNKDQLDLQIKERALHAAAAAAAAQASAARGAMKEQREAFAQTYEKNLAAGMSPQQAEAEAGRMVQNLYGGGAGERPAGVQGAKPDPVSMVPKDQRSEASKEFREHSDRENAKKKLEQAFAQFEGTSVLSRSERAALKAQVRGIIKPHMKGANSDADLEALIEPFVPSEGITLDSAQRTKLRAAKGLLDAEGTTPTLDQHAPGWRGPEPVKQYTTDGKPR